MAVFFPLSFLPLSAFRHEFSPVVWCGLSGIFEFKMSDLAGIAAMR
jgi:hypothetical protein